MCVALRVRLLTATHSVPLLLLSLLLLLLHLPPLHKHMACYSVDSARPLAAWASVTKTHAHTSIPRPALRLGQPKENTELFTVVAQVKKHESSYMEQAEADRDKWLSLLMIY